MPPRGGAEGDQRHGRRRLVPPAGPGMARRPHASGRTGGSRLGTGHRRRGTAKGQPRPRAAAAALRRRTGRDLLSGRVRRPRIESRPPAGVRRRGRGLPDALLFPGADPGSLRGHPAGLRFGGAEAPAHPRDPARRGTLDAVPVRAHRRLGCRELPDHGDPGRRRVGARRLQGLDDRRLVGRLRALPGPNRLGRTQAPGPDGLHRQDPPAGHRHPPDRDDQRLARVLSGVHFRGAAVRQRARRSRGPGLERDHRLAPPRARVRRRRLAVRDPHPARPQNGPRRDAGRVGRRDRPTRRPQGARPAGRSLDPGPGPASARSTRDGRDRRREIPQLGGRAVTALQRNCLGATGHDRLRTRRHPRHRMARSRCRAGKARHGLPDAPVVVHRRRHHGDGAQRHRRPPARHAARNHSGPATARSGTCPRTPPRRRNSPSGPAGHGYQPPGISTRRGISRGEP